jgi:hypothetical protein
VKRGQLMCRSHWFAIPKALRLAINATWRGREFRAYLANVREAERLLREDEGAGA